jgi:hypothetical protein
MSKITAPWTLQQVDALNGYQRAGRFHPFTCGGDRGDYNHVLYSVQHGESETGLLVATTQGWICPACSYTQNWAHEFMARISPGDTE